MNQTNPVVNNRWKSVSHVWRKWPLLASGTALGVLVVAIIVLAGVLHGGGDSDVDQEARSNLEALMALIPDTPETRQYVYLYDYERMRDFLGVPIPSDLSDDRSLDEYLNAFPFGRESAGSGFISGLSAGGRVVIRPETIGYGAANVDGEIRAGVPPREFEAIVGRFEPERIDSALRNCPNCPQPQVMTYEGRNYYSWGEDFETNLRSREQPPVFDELGRGGRWSFTSSFVLRAQWTAGIEAMINASNGTRSLMGDPDYSATVRVLATIRPFSAAMTNETPGGAYARSLGDLYQQLGLPAPAGQLLRPYSLIGTGCAADGAGSFLAIVLAHRSEAAAHDNVQILGDRIKSTVLPDGSTWSSRITHLESGADGRFLVARLHGSIPCLTPDALFPLLVHE
jgi:hypothetical protein